MNNNIGILGADEKYHAPAWYKPAKRTTPSKDVTLSAKKSNESAGKQHTEKSADKKVEPATSKEIASTDKKSIVSKATGQVGVPYLWGGSSPSGFDCSGLVTYIFKQQGINLPRTSSGMYGVGTSVSNPEQGDLVFFANGGKVFHVGVYVGGNRFISATDDGVKIDSLGNSYWNKYYIGAKKVM